MSKRIAALFLFVCCSVFAFSVELQLKVDSTYIGQNARFIRFSDFLTYTEEELASKQIPNTGIVSFSSALENTSIYLIRVGDVNAVVYLDPNGEYEFEIPAYTKADGKILSKEKFVIPEILKEPKHQLNKRIRQFNYQYDEFVAENLSLFISGRAYDAVQAFEVLIEERFTDTVGYLAQHIEYSLENLKLSARFSKRKVFERSLDQAPPLHIQSFFEVFQNFYTDYFDRFRLTQYETKLHGALTAYVSFDSVVSVLQHDIYLKRKDFAELVAINELYRKAQTNQADSNVISILNQAAKGAQTAYVRKTASNILQSLGKLQGGSLAPDFEFIDQNGNTVRLSDLKGKYVYLDFWATWCTPCIREMPVIADLQKKYGDMAHFVSISIDKNSSRFERYIERNEMDWIVGHFNHNEKIKEDYEVKIIPLYYLISPEGYFIESPARSPSQGIENFFYRIKAKEEREQQKPKIWDWNQRMNR